MRSKPQSTLIPVEPTKEWLGCLELYWILRSPQGRLLQCSLYQVGTMYEVRVGFGKEPPLRTKHVVTIKAAALAADKFKTLALSIGYIERYQSGDQRADES